MEKIIKLERSFTNFKQKWKKEKQRKEIKVGGNIRKKIIKSKHNVC